MPNYNDEAGTYVLPVPLQSELANLQRTERIKVDKLDADLKRALAGLEAGKKIRLDGNRIVMTNSVLFASGSVEITPEGKKVLNEIWSVLVQYPDRDILIEGHTDNADCPESAGEIQVQLGALDGALAVRAASRARNKGREALLLHYVPPHSFPVYGPRNGRRNSRRTPVSESTSTIVCSNGAEKSVRAIVANRGIFESPSDGSASRARGTT